VEIISTSAIRNGSNVVLEATLSGGDGLSIIFIEGGSGGRQFRVLDSVPVLLQAGSQQIHQESNSWNAIYFRLHVTDSADVGWYSDVFTLQDDMMSRRPLATYPNPVSHQLNLDFLAPATEKAVLRMTSTNGQMVKELIFNANQGQNHMTIPMDGLPTGLYFFRILYLASGQRLEGRVVKQ
jgi:hypothetical protein